MTDEFVIGKKYRLKPSNRTYRNYGLHEEAEYLAVSGGVLRMPIGGDESGWHSSDFGDTPGKYKYLHLSSCHFILFSRVVIGGE